MISIPKNRIYNAYIIETYNYESAKKAIKEFAILNGFEKAYVDTDNHPDIFYLETEENIKIEIPSQENQSSNNMINYRNKIEERLNNQNKKHNKLLSYSISFNDLNSINFSEKITNKSFHTYSKSSDKKRGSWYNRLCNKQWCRNTLVNIIAKLTDLYGIKLQMQKE